MSTMALKLPISYVDMEKDEMEYVDGGLYISYNSIAGTVNALRLQNMAIGAMTMALAPTIPMIFAWVNVIPVVGQMLFLALTFSALGTAGLMASAYFRHQGIDVSLTKGIRIM